MTPANWPWRELGAVFVIAGMLLMIWALFWDRSRGRRRCPNCWYDLRGLEGLTCPECGYTVIVQRSFYRTRRRWRYVLVATLLVVMGCAGWAEQMRRGGRWSLVPNIVLIEFLPVLSFDRYESAGFEIRRRVGSDDLRQWEYRRLIRRSIDVLESTDVPSDRLRRIVQMLNRIEGKHAAKTKRQPWGSWVRLTDVEPERAILALIAILHSDDPDLRTDAKHALSDYRERAAFATPVILGLLCSDDRSTRGAARMLLVNMTDGWVCLNTFPRPLTPVTGDGLKWRPWDSDALEFFGVVAAGGLDPGTSIPLFLEGLSSESPDVRMVSVWALALLQGQEREVQNRILELAPDEAPEVRAAVVRATSVFPWNDRVEKVINAAFGDTEQLRGCAMSATRMRGTDSAIFADHVRQVLDHEERDHQLEWAARTWVRIGGDPHVAIDALLKALDRHLQSGQLEDARGTLIAISEMGIDSEAARQALQPLLELDHPVERCYVATASAMCGGDGEYATRLIIEQRRKQSQENLSHAYGGKELGQAGRLSIPLVCDLLESPADSYEEWIALRWLEDAAAHAAEALPKLRALRADMPPDVAREADIVIKRIEWERRMREND